MHDNALPRRGIHRAGYLRPALGHVGPRVGARIEPNLERIARSYGGIELDGHLFVAHSDQAAHAHALVNRALKAHELGTRSPPQIRIGEPAVERPTKLTLKLRHDVGLPRAIAHHIERPAPHTHYVEHVVGILHAPLDLERRHAGGNKLGQVCNAQIVTRAQQAVALNGNNALPCLVHQVVRQTARLRAVTAHRRASAPQGRELAGARVTDANGTVAENLNRHARGTQRGNLVDRQLARGRHALDSQLVGSQSHGPFAMDARLRGQVNLDPGNRRAQRASQPGIRHDQGIGAQLQRMRPQRHGIGQLVVEHKNVERHVHAHAMGMRHGAATRKLVVRKAMRAHACVETAQARIDGIGARRNSREHLVESARRRQQFGQRRPSGPRPVHTLSARSHRPNRHRQTPYQGMHSL